MKKYLSAFMLACSAYTGFAQDSTAARHSWQPYYQRHSATISFAVGFVDGYRNDYSYPAGFQKGNTSGFAPFSARVEYALTDRIGLAAILGYDAFVYNFRQEYVGNNGPFTRNRSSNTRVFSGGIAAYYHLHGFIRLNRVDPFVGAGLSLNNIRYGAQPQGDSTLVMKDHTVSPYLKIGARYYISDRFSLLAEAGYEKQSLVNIGFSCRFLGRKKAVN